MDPWDVVRHVIAPRDAELAQRIHALLWAYERGEFQDRVRYGPLDRRDRDRAIALPAEDPGRERS